MKKIEFSNEDCVKIIDMYKNNISVTDICKNYNCSRKPITKLLHSYGITLDTTLRKVPKCDYENVVDLYNNGKTQAEIADIYCCSSTAISQILKKMNASIRPNGFTKEDAEKMYKMYKDGKRLLEIAKFYNTDRHTVGRVLKRNGFKTDRKTYHCNEYYFDNIDNKDKAYILGLLWADGHNSVDLGKITIQLQERDKQILEDINKVTQSNMPLWFLNLHDKNPNWSNTYTLTFRSRHMSNILESYGMVQRKSLVLEFPQCVDEYLYSHFIRGYIDGDGSIYYSQSKNVYRISMVGTKMFLEFVQTICNKIGVKTSLHHKDSHNNVIYTLSTTSNIGTLTFLKWIYNDATLKLQRKYDKYQQIIYSQNINNSLATNDCQSNILDEIAVI